MARPLLSLGPAMDGEQSPRAGAPKLWPIQPGRYRPPVEGRDVNDLRLHQFGFRHAAQKALSDPNRRLPREIRDIEVEGAGPASDHGRDSIAVG